MFKNNNMTTTEHEQSISEVLRADVCENRDSRDSLKKPKFCLFHQNILFRELF